MGWRKRRIEKQKQNNKKKWLDFGRLFAFFLNHCGQTNFCRLISLFAGNVRHQRRRQLRSPLQVQRPHLLGRRSALGPARHLPGKHPTVCVLVCFVFVCWAVDPIGWLRVAHNTEFVHDRRDVLPVRPANVSPEIRLLDVQRRPGVARFLPGQAPRRLIRLLEIRYVGHHRGAGQAQRPQPHETHPDGHNLLHHHPAENTLLHGQLDPSDRPHFLPLRLGLLLAGRGRRESHAGHQHSPLACRVPLARLQDPAAHLPRLTAHRQVSPVHFHHEHSLHSRHRRHHQLELPRAENSSNAKLDPRRLPQVSANPPVDETAQEDPTPVDDGAPGRRLRQLRKFRRRAQHDQYGHEHGRRRPQHLVVRLGSSASSAAPSAAATSLFRHFWRRWQNGGDGTGRPAPSRLPDEPAEQRAAGARQRAPRPALLRATPRFLVQRGSQH